MAEEEQINDFLLDQELAPDLVPGEHELPDDIDAILDAVEDEDISVMPKADESEPAFDPSDFLSEPDEQGGFSTHDDLDQEINIAAGAFDDNIPVMSDIIDPNHPPAQAGNSMLTLSDELMFEIMAKIQHVVEESVNKEIGKLATTVRDNVVQDVKDQLPGVLSQVLRRGK